PGSPALAPPAATSRTAATPGSCWGRVAAPGAVVGRRASSVVLREPELSEDVVQPELRLGGLAPVAHDQAAGQIVAAGGKLTRAAAGDHDRPRRHHASMLDGFGAGDVDHGNARREHDAGGDHRVAPDPDALDDHHAGSDERSIPDDHRPRLDRLEYAADPGASRQVDTGPDPH